MYVHIYVLVCQATREKCILFTNIFTIKYIQYLLHIDKCILTHTFKYAYEINAYVCRMVWVSHWLVHVN